MVQQFPTMYGIPIIFMILVVAIYTLLNKQGDD